MARMRAEGGEPDPTLLDLYSRMAGAPEAGWTGVVGCKARRFGT